MLKAVVIGAGIGGIAAAARLAKQGYEVLVLEKNASPGGRCGQLLRDGHRFDIGPTLLLMPAVFAETYAALGEKMSEQLDLRRIDPTYRIYFQDGAELALTGDLQSMQGQLESIEPGSFGGFLRYLAEGQRHYEKSLSHFVGRNFYSLLDYFSPANIPLLFELKALTRHYSNVSRFFSDPRLKAAFTFQNMYLGLSPYDAPATYSLLQYTELADGVWFPMGGMYEVIRTLEQIATGLGVRFEYGAPVEEILLADGRANGVRLVDGRSIPADLVLANADLPYVYRELLKDRRMARALERKKFTCSAIMFYWGLDRVVPELGHHNVFLAEDYRASFDRIFQDFTLPDRPSLYIHAPARTDPTAAPPNQDSLMVLVPVGHLNDRRPQDWNELRERAREAAFGRLAEIGAGEVRDHIKFEVSLTPEDWRQRFNLEKGAAFGLSHNFAQVGYLRPQNRHPRYGNLYFVGASTHPGTGLPIVLLSARLVVERILREQPLSSRQTFQGGVRPSIQPSAARTVRKP